MRLLAVLLVLLLVLSTGMALADNHTNVTDDYEDDGSDIVDDVNDDDDMDDDDEEDYDDDMNEVEDEDDLDDEEEIEVEIDDDEVKYFVEGKGAYVRQLQLLHRVIEHVYVGNEVLNYVEDENVSLEAQLLLDQLSELAEDIKAYDISTATKEEAVQNYVAFKEEATRLTKQFRDVVKDSIDEGEKEQIKRAMQDIENNDLAAIKDEIKTLTREHNQEKAAQQLQKLGVNDPELLEQIANGELSIGEAVSRMKARYETLSEERKEEIRLRLQQENEELEELRMKVRSELKDDIESRIELRLRERAEDAKELRIKIESGEWSRSDTVARVHAANDAFRMEYRERLEERRLEIREDGDELRIRERYEDEEGNEIRRELRIRAEDDDDNLDDDSDDDSDEEDDSDDDDSEEEDD